MRRPDPGEMTAMQKRTPDPELRQRAEAEVQEKGRAMNLPEQDVRKLCHEFEVHQIELELQNEALQELQRNLQASEEKYRDLYEFAPIGYYTLDPNGEILETNLAGASLLGRGRARLIGARLQFFLEPEDIDLLNAFIDRAGSSDTKEACDVRLKRNGGELAWVLLEGKSAAEGDGTRIRVAATDITKRKQAERALRESEARERRRASELQAVMEAVPAAVFIALDPESRTIYGSRWTYDLFRIPPGGNLSKSAPEGERPTHFRTMKDGAEIPPAELPIQKAAATGRPVEQVELDLVLDDGTMHRLLGNAVPLLDESGRSYGAVGAFIDITERKRAEEALKENVERYQQFFNNPLVGYALCEIITDEHGNPVDFAYLEINQAFEDLTGLKREDVLHRRVTEILVPEEVAELTQRYGRVALTGESTTFHYPIPSLSKWFEIAVFSPQQGRFIAFFTDITDRKRVEEALQRRTDDLIRKSEELEAARDEANMYLDIMTHDVRNANNVSSMYADLLVELLAGDQWLYARKLHASIERSSDILRNVATIRRAQEESGRLVPVNLDAVIREEIGSFPGASIRYAGPQVEVLADNLMPTIFTNLIGNSVKFGGPDVEITIRVEEPDGEVLVSVEDTGPGVPDEVKGKLFHRFERGMARGSGEGLGLFIVRTLVTRYGGEVWVDDRVPDHPDEGAAFRFTLKKAA